MTSPPGLLSMNKISTRCQINSSLYIGSDCSRIVHNQIDTKIKVLLINLGKVMRGLGSSTSFSEMFQLLLTIFYHTPVLSGHPHLVVSRHRSAYKISISSFYK